jgi:perosamine synthetase
MSEKMILTAGPSITEREVEYVMDAVKNGWNENWSGYLRRFEHAFAEYIGVRHAMATSSCTGAMHLALLTMGIGPGDEVIVPELTWVATASVVKYTGAEPVFCDVEEISWGMSPASVASLITPRTKAIMPVHLYGHPAPMPALVELARKHKLLILEDAAPSVGAAVAGKRTGSFGDMSAFSFQGAKVLVTGEGGMLVSNNEAYMKRAGIVGDHGRDEQKALWNNEIGYKYKMSNLQAALGLAQLERIEELVERKRQINVRYHRNLDDFKRITVSSELPGCRSIHWMTSIEVKGINQEQRLEIINKMRERNVDSRPVFYPLSTMPMFKRRVENPVAYRVGHNSINLASGHNLTDAQIDRVSEVVREVVNTY